MEKFQHSFTFHQFRSYINPIYIYIYIYIYMAPIFNCIPKICVFIRKFKMKKEILGMIILIFLREGSLVSELYC